MSKFTFICEEESMPFGDSFSSKRTVEFSAETLNEVVSEFENFLRGCGFSFNGELDFINYKDLKVNFGLHENLNELLCPVCKISNHIMSKNDCYDKNCPKVN